MANPTAVILAGGAGIRLRPLTASVPKSLVKIREKPMLEWIIRWLRNGGVRRIVIGVAYKKEMVKDFFGNGSKLGVEILYSEHTVKGGTNEGFRLAISRFVDDTVFFALNGDQITDLDLHALRTSHIHSNPVATIAVGTPRIPFGRVRLNSQKYIVGFEEKPVSPFFCSMGIYAFNKRILDFIPSRGNIEDTVFPKLAHDRMLKAFVHRGYFVTVNTQKDLAESEEALANLHG